MLSGAMFVHHIKLQACNYSIIVAFTCNSDSGGLDPVMCGGHFGHFGQFMSGQLCPPVQVTSRQSVVIVDDS